MRRPPPIIGTGVRLRERQRGPVLGLIVVLAGALLASIALVPWRPLPGGELLCTGDVLQAKAVAGLANFSSWLRRNDATGFVGEVGWPADRDRQRWNALAEAWYRAADRIGLPVTAWAAGSWPDEYPLAAYARDGSRRAQAEVIERHPSTGDYLRGINLAAGSFAAADTNAAFSTHNPGRYGQDYTYESPRTYRLLARHGIELIRLAVSWERLQPVPFEPLDQREVARVVASLDLARDAGLKVVLDLHNYGDYAAGNGRDGQIHRLRLGSATLPTTALADFWSRTVKAAGDHPSVIGLGILNEPTRLAEDGRAGARIWERASQQAVEAIRETGNTDAVLVAGHIPMGPPSWGALHPRAWIDDPARRVAYDSHAYFDGDGSGRYWNSYADEMRAVTPRPRLCQTVTPLAFQVLR